MLTEEQKETITHMVDDNSNTWIKNLMRGRVIEELVKGQTEIVMMSREDISSADTDEVRKIISEGVNRGLIKIFSEN